MSLSFSHGSTHSVDFGTNTVLDDMGDTAAVTMMVWINLDTLDASERNLVISKPSGGNEDGLGFYIGHNSGTAIIDVFHEMTTTYVQATAANANFSAFGTGKWIFVAGILHRANDSRLLVGDLTTAPAEPSSYSTQSNGVGSYSADFSQNLTVGNGRGLLSVLRTGADIAVLHIVNANLTNKQIREQWMRPHVVANSVLFTHLGFNGTGTQPDWSGNGNAGTVTGATAAAHVPLMPGFGFDEPVTYAVAGGGGSQTKTGADALTEADDATVAAAINASDSITKADDATVAAALAAADAMSQAGLGSVAAAATADDSFSMGDSATVQQGTQNPSGSDAISMAEDARVIASVQADDTAVISEVRVVVAQGESETITMSGDGTVSAAIAVGDTIAMGDSANAQAGQTPSGSDSVSMAESAVVVVTLVANDTVVASEDATGAITINGTDVMTLADLAVKVASTPSTFTGAVWASVALAAVSTGAIAIRATAGATPTIIPRLKGTPDTGV